MFGSFAVLLAALSSAGGFPGEHLHPPTIYTERSVKSFLK